MRILLVEDEPKVANAVREGLEGESYAVAVAYSGEDGFYRLRTESFDLVILDVMLPGRSGLEILAAARRQGLRAPVLLLTAKDAVEDRVRGLDAGADDYLVKPFAFSELAARVRELLRRSKIEPAQSLKVADLELDLVNRTVRRGGRALELTPREFELLEYLAQRQGEVVSRDLLARDVWREPTRHTPLDNVINVHMVRLRRKVDGASRSRLIHTVRGVGFVIRPDLP